jgi:putative membrane protein
MWGWHDHEMSAWGWWLMTAGMVIFWGIVAWAVVYFVRRSNAPNHTRTAESVLAERYAHGEIDEEEFRRRRAIIRDG